MTGMPTDAERVAALIFAHVTLAVRIAAGLVKPRAGEEEAGAFLMAHASELRTAIGAGFAPPDATMEIVNGLETAAEMHFGVRPRQ
jgi:hypothetical protein